MGGTGPSSMRRWKPGIWIAAAVMIVSAPARGAEAASFASCEAQFIAAPRARAPALCFYDVAERENAFDDGARRMDALIERHPDNPWLLHYRGDVEWWRDPERAQDFYRRAAALFAERGDAEGEVLSRGALRAWLVQQRRLDEAAAELERATQLTDASRDPELKARGLVLRGRHLWETGQDLGRAVRVLGAADELLSTSGPDTLKMDALIYLGNVLFDLGHYDESIDAYRRAEPLVRASSNALRLAAVQYNVANAMCLELEERPRKGGRERILSLAREALETARAAHHLEAEPATHRLLGELLGATPDGRAEAQAHLERCIDTARRNRRPQWEAKCLWALGHHFARQEPARARHLVDAGLVTAIELGNPTYVALAWRERMHLSWETGAISAVEDSQRALDATEAFRDLQPGDASRAEFLARWVRDYLYISGQLLRRASSSGAAADLEWAFAVTERMRARVLLEALAAADAGAALPASHPLSVKHRELLQHIQERQRRALDPRLRPDERQALSNELQQLESAEDELLDQMAQERPALATVRSPRFASLRDVQRTLGADEAMLSFQLGLWEDLYGRFGGGAWLLVVTHDRTRLYRVPDATRLDPAVAILAGLVEGGRAPGDPALRLYRDLLGQALDSLPGEVHRLVIVPDGALHRLPFGALRAPSDAQPLALRYDLSVAPSATLWLRWRRAGLAQSEVPALVLADPALADVPRSRAAAEERGWPGFAIGSLPPLPDARREGAALRRRLGGGTLLLTGDEASERFVKEADLTRFAVLHFAAHAVADEANPKRSAILLAPGGPREDGLLQTREVAGLDLEGRVVVLAACRSASGRLLRGEGVQSLARGFLQAGARAVVASLWPLRDADAAVLFDVFYEQLGRGTSVAAALRAAQSAAWQRGLTPASWASLVVIGDGAYVPLPAPHAEPPSLAPRVGPGIGAAALAAALVLAGWSVRHRLRKRSPPGAGQRTVTWRVATSSGT